jgi:hypothetical protein
MLLAVVAAPVEGVSGQDKIQARVGNHQGYDRAVFDWPGAVGYDVQTDGRAVRVVFEQARDLDIATMARKFASAATDLKTAREGDSAVVSFTLPPRVQLRHFRNGNSIVLDFVRSGANAPPIDPTSARQLAQERNARSSGATPANAVPAQIVPPPPPAVGSRSAAAAPAAPQSPLPPPPTAVSLPSPPVPPASEAPAAPEATPARAAMPLPLAPPPQTVSPARPGPTTAAEPPATRPATAPSAPAPASASGTAEPPPQVIPAPVASAETAPPSLTVGPLPSRATNAEPLLVEVSPSSVGYRLRFAQRELPPLAAFVRDGIVWVVLERRLALDLSQVQARQRELGRADVSIVETPVAATSLRLAPPGRPNVGVLREADAWVVEIGALPTAPARPFEPTVRAHTDGSGGRVGVDMPGVRSAIRLKDPERDDEVIVVPTSVHGAAVPAQRGFAEFSVLASRQGVVVQPLSDLVQVKVLGEGVEISGTSPIPAPGAAQVSGSAVNPRQKLLEIEAWRGAERGFDVHRQALNRAIAEAPPQRRGSERLKLAQFLFSQGYAVEAMTQLRTLETEAPRLAQSAAVRTLRGAAAVMADDIEDADRSLAQPALALSNEAALWRGIVRLRQGANEEASELTMRGIEFAEDYPAPIGPKVLLAMAQAQVAAGRNDDAAHVLEFLKRHQLGDGDRRQLTLLRGRILELQGDVPGALAAWQPLEREGPSPARAEAILARVELLNAAKQIDRGQAIETLERLRLTWRGDRTELRTLLALARIHAENANHRAGLRLLREASALFPTAREAREIANEMDLLFGKLFLDGEADKLPPVQAIALFDEFRDLVPTNARGDAMVRKFADRLVQVDLMDRAAALLEHQIRHRATAPERAALGARLATIRLLDASPAAALQSLAESDAADAPDALRAERRRLEAQALAELGRGDDALARLDGDASTDADRLRVEILRRARDWRGVAAALGRLAGEPPPAGGKLPEERALAVLHRATALALAGDDPALEDLRRRFAAGMETSAYAALFRVVASGPTARGGDAAVIAQQVAAMAPFQTFLQVYRDKLGAPPERRS